MAEIQEVSADKTGKSSQKLHADIGQAFLSAEGLPRAGLENIYWARRGLFTDEEDGEAFKKMAIKTGEYSAELIERWIKEIDTYTSSMPAYSPPSLLHSTSSRTRCYNFLLQILRRPFSSTFPSNSVVPHTLPL
ncbi:hypothetical protein GY45DRAFT_1332361 [Cubamyces sp. BRFM 1775]|nr:hypothetical protein GY45DRAFT_1332361 [Cubamyces sp. BRFM 1775]